MKDTRYSNSKKRFDGFKNSFYLCKTKVLLKNKNLFRSRKGNRTITIP